MLKATRTNRGRLPSQRIKKKEPACTLAFCHDAQDMTRIAPTGMIFVPSIGGVSHSPKEYSSPEAVSNGANVLLRTVLAIDGGAIGSVR